MMGPMRRALAQLASDEWQMPLALSAGVALLTGFSLQTLVDDWLQVLINVDARIERSFGFA